MQILEKPLLRDREWIVQKVREYGGTTTDAILDPLCKAFFIPEVDGFIGYRQEDEFAIALGDPVSSLEDQDKLHSAFKEAMEKEGFKVIYALISLRFANWLKEHGFPILIELLEVPYLNPQQSPMDKTGTRGSLVRRKVKHAIKEKVEVSEYTEKDETLQKAMEEVGTAWLNARQGPQIHISHIRLFSDTFGKRWFYAKKGKKIVGVLLLNRVKAQGGWLLNRLMIRPDAPHGTPELLVVTALNKLKDEGCQFVSFGMIPKDKVGRIEGLNPITAYLTRQGFKLASIFYRLDGLRKFWEKYQPETEPSYIAFTEVNLASIKGLMKAFNASM